MKKIEEFFEVLGKVRSGEKVSLPEMVDLRDKIESGEIKIPAMFSCFKYIEKRKIKGGLKQNGKS